MKKRKTKPSRQNRNRKPRKKQAGRNKQDKKSKSIRDPERQMSSIRDEVEKDDEDGLDDGDDKATMEHELGKDGRATIGKSAMP